MEKIGLFYGSSTGNTKDAAEIIKKEFGDDIGDIYDICGKNNEDLQKYNNLILGISTWGEGELQDDWDDFLPKLENIDFSGKKIALYGLGGSGVIS